MMERIDKILNKSKLLELTITADNVVSTDDKFSLDNLGLGDNYKPVSVVFTRETGETIRRKRNRNERGVSNQTLPRLVCQVFEAQLSALTEVERINFPICRYNPESDTITGIFQTVEAFKAYRNTLEFVVYKNGGAQFVFYCWNIFSTIYFVQECLQRFGLPGEKFVMTYIKKDTKEEKNVETITNPEKTKYRQDLSNSLLSSKNIILRGAPGTGKSYLAKKIAADIISEGETDDFEQLTEQQKQQVDFVQFHPSFDYTDFVEGLRPTLNEDGSMGFTLRDGIFKEFVTRARINYENSQKSLDTLNQELTIQEMITAFFSDLDLGTTSFKTINGSTFYVLSADEKRINISIPNNEVSNKLALSLDNIRKMLESGKEFRRIKDLTTFFGKMSATQAYSYEFTLYKAIKDNSTRKSKNQVTKTELKKYIFIIDEINRGEISKIFGELFFAIDPGYRGRVGEVVTQYANLHTNFDKKFYIPENVYIIGTMNDIDRSVDSFDFAMRRRFRFIELKANEEIEMLNGLPDDTLRDEAIKRMVSLNQAIVAVDELNENYQIGAAYFLKLSHIGFEQLWTDYLEPLLREYVQGIYNEHEIMKKFSQAYGNHD